ncbi:histidine--tRNA ligase, cytoplasmic-like isoform X2 [Tasmannia lanceolata]|uniref:histidine--tRNA ligase, cytoplasmic-like isoform X2 n=1 Tax=Tasmannia lanceolata TaxID=3420 RepID=UPI004063A03C
MECWRFVECLLRNSGQYVQVLTSWTSNHMKRWKIKVLTVETAENIGSFVKKRGPPLEILSDLKKEGSQFNANSGSVLALNELEILFRALEKSKCLNRLVFDLSLARGLDYYTGVIFEAVFKGKTQVGSIAAGGRYDNLVGMFSGKQVPTVGVSLGIERVFTIMEEQLQKDSNQVIRATETQVLVVFVGKDLVQAAELVSELWNAKVKAEFTVTKKVMRQIDHARQSGIPLMVILGESELANGVVNVKEVAVNKEEAVPRERLVEDLQRRLSAFESLSNRYVVV